MVTIATGCSAQVLPLLGAADLQRHHDNAAARRAGSKGLLGRGPSRLLLLQGASRIPNIDVSWSHMSHGQSSL